MNTSWFLNPLVQYGFLAAVLISSLALVLTFKFEVAGVRRKSELARKDMDEQIHKVESTLHERMESAIHEVHEKLAAQEKPAPPPVPPPAPAFNLTKRSSAIRMHHRGESIETIAAALQTPRNEIELALRLQKVLAGRTKPGA